MEKKNLTIKETFSLAFENHKKNNFSAAEKLYQQVLEINPSHFDSIFYLASLSAQMKNFNKAKELFEKVIKINPKYPSVSDNLSAVYRMLANLSSKNGNLLEAKNLFEKTLILNPNNLEVAHGYGVLLLKLNLHSKGLNYIRKGTGFIRFTPESYKII